MTCRDCSAGALSHSLPPALPLLAEWPSRGLSEIATHFPVVLQTALPLLAEVLQLCYSVRLPGDHPHPYLAGACATLLWGHRPPAIPGVPERPPSRWRRSARPQALPW
eukprot:16404634-Heterocapsa_arctica.AAC.1